MLPGAWVISEGLCNAKPSALRQRANSDAVPAPLPSRSAPVAMKLPADMAVVVPVATKSSLNSRLLPSDGVPLITGWKYALLPELTPPAASMLSKVAPLLLAVMVMIPSMPGRMLAKRQLSPTSLMPADPALVKTGAALKSKLTETGPSV